MGAKGLKKINHWEKINYGAWSRKVAVNEKKNLSRKIG